MKYFVVVIGMLLAGALAVWAQVDIEISVSPAEVYPGEWITIEVSVGNLTEEFILVDLWGTFEHDGVVIREVGPRTTMLPPAGEIGFAMRMKIPRKAPSGLYVVNAYVGKYPDEIWDEEHESLTVLEP